MKRIITILILAAITATSICAANRSSADKGVSKNDLISLISEYSSAPGMDMVNLGSFGTSVIKKVIKIAARADGDPDVIDAMKMINGIKRISIVDFEGCSEQVRSSFNRKLQRVLSSSDLLMEVKDEGENMSMYGVVDDNAGKVRDFVLYSAENCALICLFGSISIDAIMKLAAE